MPTSRFWEYVDSQPVNPDLWQFERTCLLKDFLSQASSLARGGHGSAHLMVSPYDDSIAGEGAGYCALANLLLSLHFGSTNSAAASANILGTPKIWPSHTNVQPASNLTDILDRSVATLGKQVFAWVMREGEDDFHFPNRRETCRTFLRRVLLTDDGQIIPWVVAGICCLNRDRLKIVVVPNTYQPAQKKVNGLARTRAYHLPKPRAFRRGVG